jgi:predicted thioesterase
MDNIKIGTKFEKVFIINEKDTALALGSGGENVLATPRLAAWMENLGFESLESIMNDGKTTVGTEIKLSHIAASAIGMEVKVQAILIAHEKKEFVFEIEAWDNIEKIGKATHKRYMIDKKRFMDKALKKAEKSL